MAGFAAAFQQDSNNAWLNELFGDIVEPSNGRGPCATYGRDSDDDMVDDPDDENVAVSRTDKQTNATSGEVRVPTRRHRMRVSPTSPQLPASQARVNSPVSMVSDEQGSSKRKNTSHSSHENFGDRSDVPSPWHDSDTTRIDTRLSMQSPVSTLSSQPSPTKPEAAFFKDLAPPVYTSKRKVIPRTPAGLLYDSRYTLSPVLKRQDSEDTLDSQFSGFPSHPGVRPLALKEREVLGEAAGPISDEHGYPKPLPLTLIIIGICLSVFVISLDRNIVTTAIPEITARFHSYNDIGWYGSAYLLTASAFQPLYGRIYMSFNTKSSFLLALGIFEVGSVVCGTAQSSPALIVGRAIQGLGSAGILTGSFVVGTHSVRLEKRPILFAAVGILFGVGALCGPMLGGVFTDLVSWRWCFYVNLPVGFVTFVTVFLCFRPNSASTNISNSSLLQRFIKLDWIGNFILLAACSMLFLALEFSEERYSWSSARCIGLICGFGATTMIFIAWLFYKGKEALIPIHIVRQRTVAASCGAAFFIYGALLLHSYYLPIWFQAIKGASALQSGVDMIPYMVVNAFFSLLAGIFVSKNGLFAPPAILGCAIGTIGAGLLATLHPNTSTAKWAGFEALISAGLGMAIQQGFSAVQTALPLQEVPIGTAAVVASQSLGGAIFVSVGNTLLQDHLFRANNADAIPGVNIRAVIELGATRFRSVVPPESLPQLINLYNSALQAAFIAAVPLCGCAFLCSLCMEWRSVRRKDEKLLDEKKQQRESSSA